MKISAQIIVVSTLVGSHTATQAASATIRGTRMNAILMYVTCSGFRIMHTVTVIPNIIPTIMFGAEVSDTPQTARYPHGMSAPTMIAINLRVLFIICIAER